MFYTHSGTLPETHPGPSQSSELPARPLSACGTVISLIRNLFLLNLKCEFCTWSWEMTQKWPETRAVPSLQAMASSHVTTWDEAAWGQGPTMPTSW